MGRIFRMVVVVKGGAFRLRCVMGLGGSGWLLGGGL